MSIVKRSQVAVGPASLRSGGSVLLPSKAEGAASGKVGGSTSGVGPRRAIRVKPRSFGVEPHVVVDIEPVVDLVLQHVSMRPRALHKLRDGLRELFEQPSRSATQVGPSSSLLVPEDDEVLTTQGAADLVGVSRPFMAARIDTGDVALFQQVGNQRRVLASSVRAWHERSRNARLMPLTELANSMEAETADED